jgi:hypothetical protein
MIAWIRGIGRLALVATLLAAPVAAQDLAAPTGEIILTVSGDIAVRNQDDSAVFDLEMLRALGEVSFATTTPWTDGVQEFTGVSLAALVKALGVTEGSIKATAINDYAIDIPVADAVEGGPILAYMQNGEPMPVREKGPLWLVYPYDLNEAYQAEVIFSRSIWQLVRLDVAAD